MSRVLGNALAVATAALALVVASSFVSAPALAQTGCGLSMAKQCDAFVDFEVTGGDPIDCDITAGHFSDDFAITRFPAGNLAVQDVTPDGNGVALATVGSVCTVDSDTAGQIFVSNVLNNATCQKAGQAAGTECDPGIPGDCVLPCIACEAGETGTDDAVGGLGGASGLSCPDILADPGRGSIVFRHQGVAACVVPDPCEDLVIGDDNVDIRDRAAVQGTCLNPGLVNTENATASAEDSAACAAVGCPFVEIDKTCTGRTENGDCLGDITVAITNTPPVPADGAPATNCTVSDTLDPDNAPTNIPLDCTSDVAGVVDPVAGFDLAPGETVTCTATVGPLAQTTENEATVICDMADQPGLTCQSTDTDRDPCECEEGGYKCYKAKVTRRTPAFEEQAVTLIDQFGESSGTVERVTEFCTPVVKNDEGTLDRDDHLLCYNYYNRVPRTDVLVTDQFGEETLTVLKARSLCNPAVKNFEADLADVEGSTNHYQCYFAPTKRGTDPLDPPEVTLEDQFGLMTADPAETQRLCTPTIKNGSQLPDETKHLKCYDISGELLDSPINVTSEDQFGQLDVTLVAPLRLCEIAEKEVLP